MDLFKRMSGERHRMSKSYHIIADYIVEHSHRIPFLTTSSLSKATGVSEATIVRFARFLNYEGYSDLQNQLMDSVEQRLSTVERLRDSQGQFTEKEKVVFDNFQTDMKNIQTTMEQTQINKIEEVADTIMKARRIYIIANRSAHSLGTFLQYYLNILFGNSELIHTTETSFHAIHNVNEQDLVIGISYARYTKSTLQAASFAKEKNATIIALTDKPNSPITAYADIALFAESHMHSFLDSFVAPLSVINTLIAFIGNQNPKLVEERLAKFEAIWNKYDVFY